MLNEVNENTKYSPAIKKEYRQFWTGSLVRLLTSDDPGFSVRVVSVSAIINGAEPLFEVVISRTAGGERIVVEREDFFFIKKD